MERMTFEAEGYRAAPADAEHSRLIEGYAALFDSDSRDMFGVIETVRSTAFNKTLGEFDQRSLLDHDTQKILGRVSAGTLRLETDERGLKFSVDVPETSYGNDLLVSSRRGDIKEMSFGFDTILDKWEFSEDGRQARRELIEVRLFEVSPVSFPAYEGTSFKVRSLLESAEEAGQEFLHFVENNR